MKRICIIWLALLPLFAMANKPWWMEEQVLSPNEWIGVGSASTQEDNYTQKADQAAYQQLGAQIAQRVESSSFLSVHELNGAVQEEWNQTIQAQVTQWLEGLEKVGTYTDKGTFYVCYRLNKSLYEKMKQKKVAEICALGLGYLHRAEAELSRGELIAAMHLYNEGLKAMEPWLFLSLTTEEKGKTINVPVALYDGYVSIFSHLQFALTAPDEPVQAFQPIQVSAQVRLTREGVAIHNLPIEARFVAGSGDITPTTRTNEEGIATFHLHTISGKQSTQTVRFAIAASVYSSLPKTYQSLLSEQAHPEAEWTIHVAPQQVKAYLNVTQNDLPQCTTQINGILVNNHFIMTPDPTEAELYIDLQTGIEVGGLVQGEISNLNECLASLTLRIYRYASNEELLQYEISSMRVLTPEKASYEQTIAQCTREVMKRVRRELTQKLQKLQL